MNKILFISMYPLKKLDRAPAVRSFQLWKALNGLVPTTLVEGTRRQRTIALLKLLIKGGLFRFKSVYVESATSVGSPLEPLLFIALRLIRKPLFIFIRDAYQLFPQDFPAKTLKLKILYLAWHFSIAVYKRTATKLLFPTEQLARLFDVPRAKWDLLPPGGSLHTGAPKFNGTRKIAYVGEVDNMFGWGILREACNKVAEKHDEFVCLIIGRKTEWQKVEDMGEYNLVYREADYAGLEEALQDVDICVQPRQANDYSVLTLPVKLFDYMSLGKAIISTNLPNIAKIVKEEGVGVVCEDTSESLAEAVCYLFEQPQEVREYQTNGIRAIERRHSWRHRAERLLEIMSAEMERHRTEQSGSR